jgi:hypothetical protein
MRREQSILLFILLFPVCISCSSSIEKQRLEDSIIALDKLIKPEMIYVVLEQSGCGTCLYKADEFFEDYSKDTRVTFVFTGFISEKRLHLKYDLADSATNVLIDRNSEFFRNNAQLDYPSILYFENSNLESYEVAGTDNFSAYARLIGHLNEKVESFQK